MEPEFVINDNDFPYAADMAAYLAGRASDDVTRKIEALMAADPEYSAIVTGMAAGWDRLGRRNTGSGSVDVDQAWGQLAGRANIRSGAVARQRPRSSRAPMWMAAMAVVVCGLGIGLWTSFGGWRSLSNAGLDAFEYTTGNAQQAVVTLPDRSRVLLNVGSALVIPRDFGISSRAVELRGQALFTVTQNTGAPFSVRAHGVTSTVLGTEFSVRSYHADSVVLAVASGRVQMANAVVGARQIARASDNQSAVVVNDGLAEEIAFSNQELVFRKSSLQSAIPAINRWYDVDLRLADPALGEAQLAGALVGTSIPELMHSLEAVLGVRAVRSGNTVTLHRRP